MYLRINGTIINTDHLVCARIEGDGREVVLTMAVGRIRLRGEDAREFVDALPVYDPAGDADRDPGEKEEALRAARLERNEASQARQKARWRLDRAEASDPAHETDEYEEASRALTAADDREQRASAELWTLERPQEECRRA